MFSISFPEFVQISVKFLESDGSKQRLRSSKRKLSEPRAHKPPDRREYPYFSRVRRRRDRLGGPFATPRAHERVRHLRLLVYVLLLLVLGAVGRGGPGPESGSRFANAARVPSARRDGARAEGSVWPLVPHAEARGRSAARPRALFHALDARFGRHAAHSARGPSPDDGTELGRRLDVRHY